MLAIKILKPIILSILSGILLYIAWPNNNFFPLLFTGFIPLLFALENLSLTKSKFLYIKAFFLILITYTIWITPSLSWLGNTSRDSHIISIVIIPLNYALILAIFPYIHIKIGKIYALIYFASAILFVDYISQISMLSTPYFNLGLGLGKNPWLIQHYKWIGVEGGTLWIISINLIIFNLISEKKYTLKKLLPLSILTIVIPLISFSVYLTPIEESNKTSTIAVHHSCFDPNTKKRFENPQLVIDQLFESTFSNLLDTPSIVLWSETAITRLGWIHKLENEPVISHLKSKLINYPKTTIVFGAIGFSYAKNKKDITPYSNYSEEGNYHFNTHNLAVGVSLNNKPIVRGKEIFMPFQERIPYISTLPFLANLVKQIGSRATFSPLKNRNTIINDSDGNHYEAVLCYESLFPLFMSKKSNDKIGAIIILTNEHWLKDISGSQQYLYENIAMAIQGGKPILRSSNCGISAIINQKGNIISSTKGNTNKTITHKIELNYNTTFYSKITGLFHFSGGIATILLVSLSYLKKKKTP